MTYADIKREREREMKRSRRRCPNCEQNSLERTGYFQSQWENALSDLKDAAHDGGVSPLSTDEWEIRHTPERPGNSVYVHTVGYQTRGGEFRVFAVVDSPDDVRNLRHIF